MTKCVVITGSTRGIGLGLADSFLALGCQVVINGRSRSSIAHAIDTLSAKYGDERLDGCPGYAAEFAHMEGLWKTAQARFNKVDIWINNAGVAHPLKPVWELAPDLMSSIVETNILGALAGSRVAIRGMLEQGSGQLYNMEGFGSNGRILSGLSVYGMSKSAVTYLSRALAIETRGTPVLVGTLSPGIVITDMITGNYKDDPQGFEKAKRIFNILGDRVETVAPWLARKVLANHKSGAHFEWLTRSTATWRMMTSPFRKRDLFTPRAAP
jgi:NAD(P)-dependent dehydrogenase (short-subunit alcohol dehydrogenase family)